MRIVVLYCEVLARRFLITPKLAVSATLHTLSGVAVFFLKNLRFGRVLGTSCVVDTEL